MPACSRCSHHAQLRSCAHVCRRDGEAELLETLVSEEPPSSKLQMALAAAALLTGVSACIASVAGQDPWGESTLAATCVGALCVSVLRTRRQDACLPAAHEACRNDPCPTPLHRACILALACPAV